MQLVLTACDQSSKWSGGVGTRQDLKHRSLHGSCSSRQTVTLVEMRRFSHTPKIYWFVDQMCASKPRAEGQMGWDK